jgi:hypothetical protein
MEPRPDRHGPATTATVKKQYTQTAAKTLKALDTKCLPKLGELAAFRCPASREPSNEARRTCPVGRSNLILWPQPSASLQVRKGGVSPPV